MRKWFGSSSDKRDRREESLPLPWLRIPSIYSYIKENIDPATGRLTEKGEALPDHKRRYAGADWSWASGAMEGNSFELNTDPGLADRVATLVIEIAKRNS